MSLSFRSAGTVFDTGSTSTTTFTAHVPTGTGNVPANGDVLLAIGIDWAGSGTTWTTPSGWTVVENDNDGGSQNIGLHVYRKIATGSDADQNFSLSTAERGQMVMLCYTGENSTTPVDIHGGTATDSITALQTPSVTTTVASDILISIFGIGSSPSGTSSISLSTPSGTTARVATNQNTDSPPATAFLIVDETQATAGANTRRTSNETGIGGGTYGTVATVIAIEPASGGGTPSSSESATLTDTANQIGVNGPSDSGSETEANAIGTGSTDGATLAEQNAIALLNSDAAAFAEQVAIAAATSSSDSASATDSAATSASTSTSDTATLAESIKIALSATDSAQLGEAMALALAHQDSATLQELVSVALAIADAASLTESASVTQNGGNTPSASDSATLTDTTTSTAAVSTSDIGALAEQAAIALKVTDVASLTEQIGLGLIAADSAALVEQLAIAVANAATDSAALAEVQTAVSAALAAAEAVHLGESATVQVFSGGARDWVYVIFAPSAKWTAQAPTGKWTTAAPAVKWSASAPQQ